MNLSGGQRQRVALARALVAGAPVLVLDDPLSAVDTADRARIVARLRGALAGRAVVLATQRLSTLALADRIAVLEEGGIVEEGTAAELLAAAAPSPRCSVRTPVRRSPPTGLRRLRRHADQRRGWLALLLGCATVEAAAQSGGWLLVRVAINDGIGQGDEHDLAVASPLPGGEPRRLGTARRSSSAAWRAIGQELVLGLRRELFDHLTSLSLRYFSEQRAGWIIARVTSDVDAISDVLSQGLPTLVSNVVLLPAAIIVLFIVDWRLALVAMVVLPPALVLTRWFQRKSGTCSARGAKPDRRRHRPARRVGLRHGDHPGVQPRARVPGASSTSSTPRTATRTSYAQRILSVFFPSIELLGGVATCAVLVVGARPAPGQRSDRHADHRLLPAQLVFQPLQELSDIYGQLQSAAAAMVKVSAVLDTEPDLSETGHPVDPGRHGRRAATSRTSTSPTAPSASCTTSTSSSRRAAAPRSSASPAAVSRRSRSSQRASTTRSPAACASTGSTCASSTCTPTGASSASCSRTRSCSPARSRPTSASPGPAPATTRSDTPPPCSASSGSPRRFPEGLDHPVREGGGGLSAGERQLISIARALLADPRILILDEATSNIDRPTELLIERALDQLLHGRTSIIIAHRLSTVRRADEIVVIDHGSIVQQGTEAELRASDGPYLRLARTLTESATGVRR